MLSEAECSAMRLDGELVSLGATVLHVDRLVGPLDRLRALGVQLHPAHIVVGRAAAWVHGVAAMPDVIDLAVLRHRRADAPPGCTIHIRRVRLDDCLVDGHLTVTGRCRTAVDLLADEPFDEGSRRAVAMLVDDWDEVAAAIDASGRRSRTEMHARLEALRAEAGRVRR